MKAQITLHDTALLKGFAILAIVFHNFCHWLPQAVIENEYNFSLDNTADLVKVLTCGGPHVVLNLFSYFGCYGVPVFLFLSGYGLVKKYESPKAQENGGVSLWRFTRYNALKLWRLMLVGVILLFAYETLLTTGWRHGVANLAYYFTFIVNFLPHNQTGVLPKQDLMLGPWWYFSLTMQMYLLYRLAYWKRPKRWIIGSAAVCIVLQVLAVTVFNSPGQTMLNYIRYTLLACLLPFALGVWAARYDFQINVVTYLAAWAVFIGACFNIFVWILAPLALVIIALPLVKISSHMIRFPIEWMGGISAALFVVHPVVRCYFNPRTATNAYITLAEYFVISIILAWAISMILKHSPKPRL